MTQPEINTADLSPPGVTLVGRSGDWVLPVDDYQDGEVLTFTGRYLGLGSSQRDSHINHPPGESAPKRTTCSACRWFESRIFRVRGNDRGEFLLYYVGETTVPGEEVRYRYDWLKSPYEIIEALTTIRTDETTSERRSFLSYAARRVLAQAAGYDEDVRDAYEGRSATL